MLVLVGDMISCWELMGGLDTVLVFATRLPVPSEAHPPAASPTPVKRTRDHGTFRGGDGATCSKEGVDLGKGTYKNRALFFNGTIFGSARKYKLSLTLNLQQRLQDNNDDKLGVLRKVVKKKDDGTLQAHLESEKLKKLAVRIYIYIY